MNFKFRAERSASSQKTPSTFHGIRSFYLFRNRMAQCMIDNGSRPRYRSKKGSMSCNSLLAKALE
jgi:hypothetical protein